MRATSSHTVTIKPEAVPTVLGPDADIVAAREFIRAAAGGNSLATLNRAKEYAEGRG